MFSALKFPITADNRTAAAFGVLKSDLKGVNGVLLGINAKAKQVGRSMRNIGLGLSAGITAPLGLLAGQSLRLFDQQAQAQAAVQQALLSTKGAAGKTADELFRAASGMQALTTFGDEDILRNVTAPLLTFTKVSGPIFDRAQANILDMATLMKIDLKSASILVGKALNDPIAGLSALSRTGVQFSEDQKKVIKALVATGDVAGAQALILDELESQFGGQAAAAAKVGLGPMKQLSNAIGDVKEQLGKEVASFLPVLVEKVQSAVDWFAQLSPEVKSNIVVFGGLAAAVGPVLGILGFAVTGIASLTGALTAMGLALLANPILAIIAAVAGGAILIFRNWDGISSWFAGLWGRVKSGASAGWAAIKATIAQYTPEWLTDAWDGVSGWFTGLWGRVSVATATGWEIIKVLLSGQYSPSQLIYGLWSGIGDWFRALGPELTAAFASLWEAIKAEVSSWPGRMVQAGKDMIAGLFSGLNGADVSSSTEALGLSIGRNLSLGAATGMKRGKPQIEAASREIADFLATTTEDSLGIQSPSRVFMEIGKNVVAGLGIGMRDNADLAANEMSQITNGLVKSSQVGGQMTSSLVQGFSGVLRGITSAKDALSQFLTQLGSQALTSGLNSLFSSFGGGGKGGGFLSGLFGGGGGGFLSGLFGSANGNVFSGGNVVPFARGGIVNGPTLFPMSGQKTGLMGEAGPEAVMPLTRLSNGKLGVATNTGQQRAAAAPAPQITMNPNFILELDADAIGDKYMSGPAGERAVRKQVAVIRSA